MPCIPQFESDSRLRVCLSLGIAALIAALASLALGYQVYSPGEIWRALFGNGISEADYIIRDLRLPRALLAPLTGASLAVAGVLAQSLTRNRVASPDILGLNAGAALAVVVAHVMFGINALTFLSAIAVAGALIVGILVFTIVQAGPNVTPGRIVLVGIMLAGFLTSLVQMVLTTDEATMQELLFWLAGGFEGRPLILILPAAFLFAAGLLTALVAARDLDAMVIDEESARGVGVRVSLARGACFLAIACLTGGAVAVAGPVGFIGLVAPHAARALAGDRHRDQIFMAVFVGAIFALLADTAARFIIYPSEAPVGAVTAMIGGPVLLYLLRRDYA